jgi:hypothetical protein
MSSGWSLALVILGLAAVISAGMFSHQKPLETRKSDLTTRFGLEVAEIDYGKKDSARDDGGDVKGIVGSPSPVGRVRKAERREKSRRQKSRDRSASNLTQS